MGDFITNIPLTDTTAFTNELANFITHYKRSPRLVTSGSDSRGDFYSFADWHNTNHSGQDVTKEIMDSYESYKNNKLYDGSGNLKKEIAMTIEDIKNDEVLLVLQAFFDLVQNQFKTYGITVKDLEVK